MAYTLVLEPAQTSHDLSFSGVSPANSAPTVNAGADFSITLPASASLAGAASDADGDSLTYAWSKVSGPGTVSFSNATALATTATFGAAGTYVLRLTASDGTASASDDVQITVAAAATPAETLYDITQAGTSGTFQTAPALRANGRTFVPWVNESGQHYVTEVIEATGVMLGAVLVATVSPADRHMNAALAVLPDGRVAATYGNHTDAWLKISTTAGTVQDGFGAALAVTDADAEGIPYPHPVVTEEGSGTERIYVFSMEREGDARHVSVIYTDDRATWSARQTLFTNGTEWVYMTARRSTVTGRILCGINSANPDHDGISSGYVMIYDPADGQWYDPAGSVLTLPQTPGAATLFWDGTATDDEIDWLATPYETATHIYVAFRATDRTSGDSNYYRAAYDKSADTWTTNAVFAAYTHTLGNAVAMVEGDYDTLYGVREVSGQKDVYRYDTADDGLTWSETNVTQGQAVPLSSTHTTWNVTEVRQPAPLTDGPRFVLSIWRLGSSSDFEGRVYLHRAGATLAPTGYYVELDGLRFTATPIPTP